MVDGLLGIFGIFGWQDYRSKIAELNSGIPNNFPNKCSGFSGSKYTCSGLENSGFGIWVLRPGVTLHNFKNMIYSLRFIFIVVDLKLSEYLK
jgi:hypothetical protein